MKDVSAAVIFLMMVIVNDTMCFNYISECTNETVHLQFHISWWYAYIVVYITLKISILLSGLLLVSGGFDHQVCVWDVENSVQKLRLQGHSDWVEDVSFSKDQKWVLSCSKVGMHNN